MGNSKFFINVLPRAREGGKFRRRARRALDEARTLHTLFRATRRLMAFTRGWDRLVYVRAMSRTRERANGRTNVTAGGCLRNPLLCYTLRPSIAVEQRTPVPCLAAPSASGVNILSTLFFHRTSRSSFPLSLSRSLFLRPPPLALSASPFSLEEKPLGREESAGAGGSRSFVQPTPRPARARSSSSSSRWSERSDGRRPGETDSRGGRRGGADEEGRDRRWGRGKRGTEFCKAN